MGRPTAAVTGSDGYLGTHLCEELERAGWDVIRFVLPGHGGHGGVGQDVRTIELDLLGDHVAIHAVPGPQVTADVLFHLAWPSVVPSSRDDLSLQLTGIRMGLAAIDLARALGASRVVMPGSTLEYSYATGPIGPQTAPAPNSAYGAAKVACHVLCQQKAHALGIGFNWAVLASLYSEDRCDGNVIFYVASSLILGGVPSVTACEQMWDYVHVLDAVRGLRCVAEYGKADKTYGVSHGDGWQLSRYIELTRDAVDPSLAVGFGDVPYRDDRMPEGRVDILDLARDTGYVPSVPFEKGIRRVVMALRASVDGSGGSKDGVV